MLIICDAFIYSRLLFLLVAKTLLGFDVFCLSNKCVLQGDFSMIVDCDC